MSCFRALDSFTYSRCTPTRGNDVMASEIRHEQNLKEFVEKFDRRHQWVLIAGINTKFVLIINPTFRNSKYAFLFPFSIYPNS